MKNVLRLFILFSLAGLLVSCGDGKKHGDAEEDGDLEEGEGTEEDADGDGGEGDPAADDGGGEDGGEVTDGSEETDGADVIEDDGAEIECSLPEDCDDEEPCNGEETCEAGACADGTPLADGEPCLTADGTAGTCSEEVCIVVSCGNGIVDSGEECDDGNEIDTDACPTTCHDAACGDGFLWDGHEECDDGNDADTDACPTTCVPADCGDGFVWEGHEACDDGNIDPTDACLDTCTPAGCGDGIVWTGVEECDDANSVPDDGCTNDCTLPGCGDGIVQGTEECDDGNTSDNDACLNACLDAACGDGIVWTGREACDDGNTIPDDGCTSDCRLPTCGDCLVQTGEDCDDCNADNTDACLQSCLAAGCGDGYIRTGVEECDDGNLTDTDACLSTCENAGCGDGFVWTGVEECDDGNTSSTDACLATCENAGCGDGFTWAGVEECDDANTVETDACLSTCESAGCGDGFVQTGVEECDDANSIQTDACLSTCENAECGDGFVWAGVEQCDDANTSSTDACVAGCLNATCRDGYVWAGREQCDDGNDINDDGCTNDCSLPSCGDCITQTPAEQCDDCNISNTDACLTTCLLAQCGDGFVHAGVEACDDANPSDNDACLTTCDLAVCGDGFVWFGVEECDDDNASNNDACLNTCDLAECGDAFIWTGVEQCDDGDPDNSDACLTSCLSATCGDSYVWLGVEQCDDGNTSNTDACVGACVNATCGDGYVRTGFEQCDDGNTANTDACVGACQNARCGDGYIWAGHETCDDGNTIPGDGCNATCSSVLACEEFSPIAVSLYAPATLTILGEMFQAGMHVHLVSVSTGTDTDLGVATVNSPGTTATVTVGAGAVPAGRYTVRLVNPDSTTTSCYEKLAVKALQAPTVTNVVPAVAWRGVSTDGILSDQAVTVTGTSFRITPTVRWTLTTDATVYFDATEVNWISSTQLTAVCPSESRAMPLGLYHVDVINPDGLSGRWSGTFEVTDVPPPKIDNVNPTRGPRASNVTITITGQYFQSGATVSFELGDGTRISLAPANVTFVSSTQLVAVIPGGTLPAQGLYPVWVTNPDGREDVFYSYNATESASGHWNDPFSLVPGGNLLTGRERHDMTYGCDIYGGTYMYVVGGITGANNVLSSVEISEVSTMGDLAPWGTTYQYQNAANPRVPNALTTPRQGLAAAMAHFKYIYAIGGASSDTNVSTPPLVNALASIERATVLGYETMPLARLPILHGGSGLPFGTWYYRVSAVGPWGESLGSREVQAKNTSGVVEVCWHAVTGAVSYNIYRSPAADGRSGTTRLLAKEVPGLCYTDNGRGVNQVAPGRLNGATAAGTGLALGTWAYRVTAVVGGVETVAGYREYVTITSTGQSYVNLTWDPIPGATFNLYRTSAALASPTGNETTYRIATGLAAPSFSDTGVPVNLSLAAPDGIPPLPPGSLSRWQTLPSTLLFPREGSEAISIVVPSGTTTDPDHTYLYVVGGRPDNSRSGYYTSVEKAEVLADGSLGNFGLETNLNTARAFLSVQTSWLRDSTPACPPPPEPPCEDMDGDGHYAMWCGGDDCDDTDPTIYPGAPEICGDGIDQNCDGFDPPCDCSFPDMDGDGHDRIECGGDDCCDAGTEAVLGCTPATASQIYPGAVEVCGDGIDQNCDGCDPSCSCSSGAYADVDGDGYISDACCGDDCCDSGLEGWFGCDPATAPTIHPGAVDIPCDGIDQDCDGIDFCEPDTIRRIFPPLLTQVTIDLEDWNKSIAAAVGSDGTWLALFGLPLEEPETYTIPAPDPDYSLATETLYLVASMGDDQQAINNNSGTQSFEVSVIAPETGALGPWTTQYYGCNKAQHGFGTFMYAGYLFISWGVDRETLGVEPNPLGSSFVRFPFTMTPPTSDLFLQSQTASASRFATDRCYYSSMRLNSYIFVVAGNNGSGPISTVERLPE